MSPAVRVPDPERVALLSELTIAEGEHDDFAEGHCALELVAWLAREEHSDHPACCSPVIGAFVRSWNDGLPDDESRARLLRPLLPMMVGTASTPAIEERRAWMVLDWSIRESLPAWLDAARLTVFAAELRACAPVTDAASLEAALPKLEEARKASAAARAAAWDAARDAAWDAARDAARAAAWDAARDAARAAARAVARDAAWDAAWDAARAAARAVARDALRPTVEELQLSAQALVLRLCEAGS